MSIPSFSYLFILGIVLALGCSASKSTSEAQDDSAPETRTVVEVENRSLHDLNIFVYYANQRFRLGNVRSNSSRELTIPKIVSDAGGVVLFVADGIGVSQGSLPFYRQELFVNHGETVRFYIPSI